MVIVGKLSEDRTVHIYRTQRTSELREDHAQSRDCRILGFFCEASRDRQDRRRFSGVRANQTL